MPGLIDRLLADEELSPNSSPVKHSKSRMSTPRDSHVSTSPMALRYDDEIVALKDHCARLELELTKLKLDKRCQDIQSEIDTLKLNASLSLTVPATGATALPLSTNNSNNNVQEQGMILPHPPAPKSKLRLPHNYVWDDMFSQSKDDIVTLTNTGIKVNKLLEKDFHRLAVEQWGYASLCILTELIEQQEISSQGVMEHIDYLKTIFRFFNVL
ncbi:hypothetical protein SNE40_020725 [Patella caerulea]|uniref:Uncharacterized protein n=1 Tax=Patella caerulea TaxID=87958 RepID=A0AAN8J5K1_PATCE